jgi:hypothetical protein
MADPPEFWVFVAANVFVLLVGTSLTALSTAAYRRTGRATLGYAALGFGLVTVGGVGESVYELGIRGTYEIGGRELLLLHSVQSILIGVGLATLFYSVWSR